MKTARGTHLHKTMPKFRFGWDNI